MAPNQVVQCRQVNLPNQVKMANYFATIKIFKKRTFDTATQTDGKTKTCITATYAPVPSIFSVYEDEAMDHIERERTAKRIDQLCKKVSAVCANIAVPWFKALEPEFSKPYFRRISFYLSKEKKSHMVYPPQELMYNWTTKCDIRDIKVVILGRQPSHLDVHSNGLAYSVVKGYLTTERSDFCEFKIPTHGDLSGWAYQGVLLLNIRLTVRAQSKTAHRIICWEMFTDAVIEWLSNNLCGLVFLLWGPDLQEKAELINQDKHYILMAAHPSPKTASKGFFGCKHFSKTNEILIKDGKRPIDWSDL